MIAVIALLGALYWIHRAIEDLIAAFNAQMEQR